VFSLLDGYGTAEEYALRATKINQRFLTVSDHGMMAAIPRQVKACDDNGIKPIFACELYLSPYQTAKMDWDERKKEFSAKGESDKLRKSYHLLAIAYTNQGYKNLVRLTSWGWTEGFYYKPRVNHEQIMAHKEGIMFTSCCYLSEIGQAFDKFGEEAAFRMVEKYHRMFGENFRLELMLLDFKKQKPYDAFILKAHDKYGIPLIITNDCHYCNPEDSHYQRLSLMVNQKSTIQEVERKVAAGEAEDLFELQDQNLWMKSEDELNQKWESDYSDIIDYDLFKQAKANTVKVCEMVDVNLDRTLKLPDIDDANEKLKDVVMEGFKFRGLPKTKKYQMRIKEEYSLICRKGFSSYFLIQKAMTDEARRASPQILGWGDGSEAVGPGRGCLSPDTFIYIESIKNYKKIKFVEIGDTVINRKGEVVKVVDVLKYPNKEEMIKLKCFYGDVIGATFTKDHKVLSTKSSDKELEWKEANDIEEGDWVFCPESKHLVDILKNEINEEYAQPLESGGYLLRIKKKKTIPPVIPSVYDLTVEGDEHNYLTSTCLVHNSAVGALTCYCLGITDIDPIKHDLLFSRFLSEARGGKSIKLRYKNIDPVGCEK